MRFSSGAGTTPPHYSYRRKTASLSFHLNKNLHGTGKIVMLDSGFVSVRDWWTSKIRASMEPLLPIIDGNGHTI